MAEAPAPRTMTAAPAVKERPDVDLIARLAGIDYPFRLREMNALTVGDLRAQAGVSTRTILNAVIDGTADLDTLACVVWLSRRQNGEPTVSYEDVAAGIMFDDAEPGCLRFPSDADVPEEGDGQLDPLP